jgi:hypothetical protein
VLWPRLRIRRLRILWNRALDVLARTVLTRSRMLLSFGGLRLWMFGWVRLSALAVRLRTVRRWEMLRAVRIVLWSILWPAVRGRLRRGVWFNLRSTLCHVLRQSVRTRTLRKRAVLRQLLRRSRVWIGLRPLQSRSMWGRMLRARRLRKLSSELCRDTESLRLRLLPDTNLREHSGSPARFHKRAWVSARYWSGGTHPGGPFDNDSQATLFAAGR